MHEVYKPKGAAGRIVSAFVFMVLLAVTTNAYTVIMRSGRHIEIPSRFVVTASTLTYEAAPGFQITLQMAAIDIAATERVNNEAPGSLLRRSQLAPQSLTSTENQGDDAQMGRATKARRTITNRDLESAMRRRRESELAYESRRKELGLPSVAESRKRLAAESEEIGAELEENRAAEQKAEDYWRGRANALRTEMAALDAEIGWVRARLDEGPYPVSNDWGNGSVTTLASVAPFISFGHYGRRSFGNFGRARSFPGQGLARPNVFLSPRQDTRTTSRVALGGGVGRGQVQLSSGSFLYGRPFGTGYPVYPSMDPFGSAFPNYDSSYERNDLITHFNELATTRAGLSARWRELEEEGRRAGVPPGWLRP